MEQQVNLFQPILRAEKRLFSGAAIAAGWLLLAASLGALAVWSAWQARRVEAAVAAVERQEAGRLAIAARAGAVPGADPAALEREITRLADAIAARERALRAVGQGTGAGGFAARLEAFGRPPVEGLWLRRIVVDARGGVALAGATREPALVPAWLEALRTEPALAGSAIADFELKRADDADAAAVATFTAAAPGLAAALRSDPFAAEVGDAR